jgi:hypothetical protein
MAALLPSLSLSLSPFRKMATSTPIFFKVGDRPTPLFLFLVREMTTPILMAPQSVMPHRVGRKEILRSSLISKGNLKKSKRMSLKSKGDLKEYGEI